MLRPNTQYQYNIFLKNLLSYYFEHIFIQTAPKVQLILRHHVHHIFAANCIRTSRSSNTQLEGRIIVLFHRGRLQLFRTHAVPFSGEINSLSRTPLLLPAPHNWIARIAVLLIFHRHELIAD